MSVAGSFLAGEGTIASRIDGATIGGEAAARAAIRYLRQQ